jgi:hypothetical protein
VVGRPETQTVVYAATGAGNPNAAGITYATLQHGGAPARDNGVLTNVPLPWSKTVVQTVRPDPHSGLWPYYYLDVRNGPKVLSYVTCSISIDGQVVSTAKESGGDVTASCGAPSHTTAPIYVSRPPT